MKKFYFKFKMPKFNIPRFWKNKKIIFIGVVIVCILLGFGAGAYFKNEYNQMKDYFAGLRIQLLGFNISGPNLNTEPKAEEYVPQTTQEEMVIKAVKENSPSVVSIIISKNLPVYEQIYTNPFGNIFGQDNPFGFVVPQLKQKGTKLQEVGGGSGFIISSDGMILTNKHVVSDKPAEYTVLTNDGKKYPAKVLALDPTQDIAIIKIQNTDGALFNPVKIGDSSNLQPGQSVIAIGNALGEFRNTVSVGVVSGLERQISASGGGMSETLKDVIQTDAAINEGNSGGPLLNLKGEVIGINVATAQGAQSIGFALPINLAKKDIEQVKSTGKITYPLLGIYYTPITPDLKKQFDLLVDYGAWVGKDQNGQPTNQVVLPDSPAQKVDIQRGDIILELNGEKITSDNSLSEIITKYKPGDQTTLKILRDGQEKTLQITIGERTQ